MADFSTESAKIRHAPGFSGRWVLITLFDPSLVMLHGAKLPLFKIGGLLLDSDVGLPRLVFLLGCRTVSEQHYG